MWGLSDWTCVSRRALGAMAAWAGRGGVRGSAVTVGAVDGAAGGTSGPDGFDETDTPDTPGDGEVAGGWAGGPLAFFAARGNGSTTSPRSELPCFRFLSGFVIVRERSGEN
jgi:hypothetical protein